MFLSVVVPCHDEEAVVRRLVEQVLAAVAATGVAVELVLVDDGSRDRTLPILKELHRADPRVRYVSLSRNFGKEAAMLAGLAYARGDAVVIMDADLQHPPRLIARMLELLEEGYDQVVARRTRDGDRRLRRLASRLYYRLANALVEVELQDGVGDFRLLSRRAVDALLQMGEYNRFSKGLFAWVGFPSVTLDYVNEARQGGGGSRWSTRRLVEHGMDGIVSFTNAPLRLATYAGLLVTALSFCYVVFLVVAAIVQGVTAPGYVTLVAAIVGIGGIQLLFLGVLGEYVGRIYAEAKQRPHFVVADASDTGGRLVAPDHGRVPVRGSLLVDNHAAEVLPTDLPGTRRSGRGR